MIDIPHHANVGDAIMMGSNPTVGIFPLDGSKGGVVSHLMRLLLMTRPDVVAPRGYKKTNIRKNPMNKTCHFPFMIYPSIALEGDKDWWVGLLVSTESDTYYVDM